MTFTIEKGDDVEPYSDYAITWNVIDSTEDNVRCEIIYPKHLKESLPTPRDFTDIQFISDTIKNSHTF